MAILVRNGNAAYSNNYFTFPEINHWSDFSHSVLGIVTVGLLEYLHWLWFIDFHAFFLQGNADGILAVRNIKELNIG